MNLQDIEARLKNLIEVNLISALPGQTAEDILVQRLTAAVQSSASPDDRGDLVAANVYTLLANPGSTAEWRKAALIETLVDLLESSAKQGELQFDGPPSITIADDPSVPPGEFKLVASHRATALPETKDMKTNVESDDDRQGSQVLPENAFLIIDGVKVFQLNLPVINVGRRLDNELVVDDPRVSRNHAQLRAIKGRYVLFDLDSSGGTFVNGQRANQTVLYPGDVISLAGVALIFGQDNPVARTDLSSTSPRNRAGADRPTAVIRTMPPTHKKKK